MKPIEVFKTISESSSKYVVKKVFGLNVFWTNDVDCTVETDPQLEFLRRVCSQNAVSATVGNLFDYADSPEELFINTSYSQKYTTVRTGCYAGEFYDSINWNPLNPLFFSNVSGDFIDIVVRDDSLVRKILQLDAVALFISPVNRDSLDNLVKLLDSEVISTEDFLEKATYLYRLAMISGADGDYFSFFSKDTGSFVLLDEPLKAADDLIRDSLWFRKNSPDLHWDDEDSMCLVKR